MINKLFSSSKNRLFRLLYPDVVWKRERLLGTAAARDVPINNATSRKRISYLERKAMAEAYIDEYRVMNAGKFPTIKNVQKKIGGSYYRIKAILQECEYNANVSSLSTAATKSSIGITAKMNGIPNRGVSPVCQALDGRISVEDFGISAEFDSSSEVLLCNNTYQKIVVTSHLNKDHEISSGCLSECERDDDLARREKCDRTSIERGMSGKCNILETKEVSSLVENTLKNDSLTALTVDNSEVPAKPGHHSEVTSISRPLEPEEINEVADQTFHSVEFMRSMHVREASTANGMDKQGCGSYYSDSAIIQELDNSNAGAEVNKISEVEMTLNCQVKVGANATVDEYRVLDNVSNHQKEVDGYTCQKMIDAPILIIDKDLCRSEGVVNLESKRGHNETSSNLVDISELNRSPESRELSEKTSLVKETSASTNLEALATEGCEFSATSNHPFEVPCTLENSNINETDVASAQDSNLGEISRETTAQKTQDQKLQESSLWGNLKSLANNMINFWRKT
ncbi:uncharacterized protein LOC130816133 isoform X2 [Amaranthus tricolor]|uniref:uncharacterized protein LOC130816133 isoform X2 n=1 Tax=Amaranthus tricolor TaxID=29722 RepID=UPI00258A8897|nr:uncharacterized protein LOC130816133 isoform X2 [Amaranthus tricolor]